MVGGTDRSENPSQPGPWAARPSTSFSDKAPAAKPFLREDRGLRSVLVALGPSGNVDPAGPGAAAGRSIVDQAAITWWWRRSSLSVGEELSFSPNYSALLRA